MEIILALTTILAVSVAVYYYRKAKEFESLFELSKSCTEDQAQERISNIAKRYMQSNPKPTTVKLNKDGSIAKKRGRKPSNAKTV